MYAMWISLKEKTSCGGNKLRDVIHKSERPVKRRSCTIENDSESKVIHGLENPMHKVIFRHNYKRHWFDKLKIGDPSRNIIEMIFREASTHTLTRSRNIKHVLRVNNSIQTLARFENYRETIKKKSYEQHKCHPRSMVDGNELLQFYGTTTTCCGGMSYGGSELCKHPACRVCRIISSGFNTVYNKTTGIRLTTSSDGLSEDNMNAFTNRKDVKRAAIVCRVIAGRIVNMVDEEYEDDHDSVGYGKYSKLEYLIVQNSSAVLPCFVIVFK